MPGKQCNADEQCASQSCNVKTGRCQGVLGTTCATQTGCKDSVCYQEKCEPTTGQVSSVCAFDEDCALGLNCRQGRWGYPNGKTCEVSSGTVCSSNFCEAPASLNHGRCADCTSDAQCAGSYNDRFRVCRNGMCVRTCKTDEHCGHTYFDTHSCGSTAAGCFSYTCEEMGSNGVGVCR